MADANVARPLTEAPRLHYLLSYSFVFHSPRGITNLLLASICMLIPIVGPIVLSGYQFEIIAALHRRPKDTYPDFDFSRFGEYLSIGVWKFLAGLIIGAIMGPLFFVLYMLTILAIVIVGGLISQGNPNNPGPGFGLAAAIIIPCALLFFFLIAAALQAVTKPLILKASLSGDAAGLFDFSFMMDFIRRTWREMILELLWMYVTGPIVCLLGLLLFFVGIYPATALVTMADAHTNWQLYEIYLARGGTPIRLKERKPAPVLALHDERGMSA